MPDTIYHVRTWACGGCGYKQDFEPTKALMDLHFNNSQTFRLMDVCENECPCCALENIRGNQMGKETDPLRKITITVMGEEVIDEDISRILKNNDDGIVNSDNPNLVTEAAKRAYRAKRMQDIADAIVEAKRFQDIE